MARVLQKNIFGSFDKPTLTHYYSNQPANPYHSPRTSSRTSARLTRGKSSVSRFLALSRSALIKTPFG